MKKISIILLVALLLTGCGASDRKADSYIATDTEQTMDSSMNSMEMEYTEDSESVMGSEESVGSAVAESGVLDAVVTNGDATQKIIKTVSLSMQTKEFDNVIAAIGAKTKVVQGYTEYSSIEGNRYYNDNGNRYANIVLRIPQEQLDTFLKEVEGLGNVTSQSLNTDNITLK